MNDFDNIKSDTNLKPDSDVFDWDESTGYDTLDQETNSDQADGNSAKKPAENEEDFEENELVCSHELCNKKIRWREEGLKCKCLKAFCAEHRFPDNHDCTFNAFEENKKILKQNNPRIVSNNINVTNSGDWDFPSYLNLHEKSHQEKSVLCWHTLGFLTF